MADVYTTLTTVTDIVNSEFIDPMLLAYAIDKTVAAPLCRMYNLAGRATKVASAAKFVKDSAAAMTEGTDVDAVALDTSQVGITAAEVGIVRLVSKVAKRTNILGEEGLMQFIMREGGELIGEKLDTDVLAIYPSASTSVGQSGFPLSLANYVAGMAKLDTNNARGTKVGVFSDNQAANLRNAVATSQAAVLAADRTDESVLNARSDAYIGKLFGMENWLSNLNATANTAVDDVGIISIDGNRNPENAPIGICQVWGPEIERSGSATPSARAEEVAITSMVGQAEISDFNYVKVVTSATA